MVGWDVDGGVTLSFFYIFDSFVQGSSGGSEDYPELLRGSKWHCTLKFHLLIVTFYFVFPDFILRDILFLGI